MQLSKEQFETLVAAMTKLQDAASVLKDADAMDERSKVFRVIEDIQKQTEAPAHGPLERQWQSPRFKVTAWRQQFRYGDSLRDYYFTGFDKTEPGVIIIPVNHDGSVLLGWHYRPANQQWSLELPRGGGEPHESIEQTALRELKEETGLTAEKITALGTIHADGGILRDDVRIIRADIPEQSPLSHDSELRYQHWYTATEIRQLISNNTITCALTISALTLATI